MRRLGALQCRVVGFFAVIEKRLATKCMFGLVESAIYLMPLSSC